MEKTSRQVVKKRKGVTIPIRETKRKRFTSVLYLESELNKLNLILDENDLNLEGGHYFFRPIRYTKMLKCELYLYHIHL